MKDNSNDRNQSEGKTPQDNDENNRPLPGEYPPSEDIMNRLNKVERVNIDLDHLSKSVGTANILREEDSMQFPESEETNASKRSPSDLTKEDYEALGPRDLSLDGGDDEQLKHRTRPVDFAADDLDIPGSELDDRNEMIGSEDEENNSYSLGGDERD